MMIYFHSSKHVQTLLISRLHTRLSYCIEIAGCKSNTLRSSSPFSHICPGSKGEALPSFKTGVGGELFALLAECEQRKNPGQALLGKAKDLRWPLLAVVASCFPDVASLSCLTVWLEVTAARSAFSPSFSVSLFSVNFICMREPVVQEMNA